MRAFSPLAFVAVVTATTLAAGCEIDRIPSGLRATPEGNGPRIRFDVVHTDVPLPNDVLTRADPTSRTGKRIQIGVTASTALEKEARSDLATLEGWGVTAPITVTFDQPLDLDAINALTADDDLDPANDPFYLVNLDTGVPVLIDGKSVAYETATNTLVLRPILPLDERTEYAVVLTDRLRGTNGQAVRSPFSFIHHPAQFEGVKRLEDSLKLPRFKGYFGDIAGTGLDHVAFAWTFTTQPTREDLRILRDGIYGHGPFARLDREYPKTVTMQTCPAPAGLDAVDHLVVGTMSVPFFLSDAPNAHFDVDYVKGTATIAPQAVPFVVAIPKTKNGSVAIYGGNDARDALASANEFARLGIATIGKEPPGHVPVPAGDPCLDAVLVARPGPAGPTNHLLRTRDVVRQEALEGVSLVRVLRASAIPDIGGPNADVFVTGERAANAILGGLDVHVVAAAPIATPANVAEDVLFAPQANPALAQQLVGPSIFAKPATEATPTQCTPAQRSIRTTASDGTTAKEIEIGCADPGELAANMTIVVINVSAKITRCAQTIDADGRFDVPIPTSTGDKLDVQIYTAPNVTDAACFARSDAPVGKRFANVFASGDGLALGVESPELRRFRDLEETVLDAANPAVFAPYYMQRQLLDESGQKSPAHALLVTTTIGDPVVPNASTWAFARAAGALPFLPPGALDRLPEYATFVTPSNLYEKLGRKTPYRFLADAVPSAPGPACKAECGAEPSCATAFLDPDWISEGREPFDQPRPEVPLRVARIADVPVVDSTSLAFAWEPRLRGTPFAPDDAAWTARARVVGVFDLYVSPQGAHGFGAPDACRAWDYATYANGLLARFFASSGKDIYYLSHPTSHGCLATATCGR